MSWKVFSGLGPTRPNNESESGLRAFEASECCCALPFINSSYILESILSFVQLNLFVVNLPKGISFLKILPRRNGRR